MQFLKSLDLGQEAWLRYRPLVRPRIVPGILRIDPGFGLQDPVLAAACEEWERARDALFPGAAAGAQPIHLRHDVRLGAEGSRIAYTVDGGISLSAGGAAGALYAVFRLIQALRLDEIAPGSEIQHVPNIPLRAYLHFDNVWPKVDIERGYGGESLWRWNELPDDPGGRQRDYARLLASCGLNALILNNVNAGEPVIGGWRLVTDEWIPKVAALAAIFRTWGIRIGLSIAYNSPQLSGELPTSDPREQEVRLWWERRADALFAAIPDFLGWVVKADSEGQAGPMEFGLDHASGSRHLAHALDRHGGRLFWRCFVYGETEVDVTAQPYRQFKPLDGRFESNVTLLIKNGPRDFQVREPLHPLFGAMPRTACALELQATQEYLGHDTHAVFLPSQWEEILGLPVQDGRPLRDWLRASRDAAIFAVANTNDSPCWTGHVFGQANWYGFARLAWNPAEKAAALAEQWARLSFDNRPTAVATVQRILLESYRTFEGYTAPFCLGQIYNVAKTWDADHFDPDPWRNNGRNWFFAMPEGVGIPRAQSPDFHQFPPAFRERVADPRTCDPDYLLWFHRLPWDWRMPDGATLLQALLDRYAESAARVDEWIAQWAEVRQEVDPIRFAHVLERLLRQRLHARLWARYLSTFLQDQAALGARVDPSDDASSGRSSAVSAGLAL
jgi:alpha-glucuronidase